MIEKARAHYLLPGDHASVDGAGDLQVRLSSDGEVLPVVNTQPPVTQDKLLDYGSSNFWRLSTAMGLQGASRATGTTHHSADPRSIQNTPYYRATLTRDDHTVFRARRSGESAAGDRVSYTGLWVALAPTKAPEPAARTTQPQTPLHARN